MQKRKILIVDEDVACMLVKMSLAVDFNVVSANNGQGALTRVEHEQPDLLLLNVLVPGVDELVASLKLREQSGGVSIPVVLINTTAESNQTEQYSTLKPVGFLSKPLNLKDLPNQINKIMAEVWPAHKPTSVLIVDDVPLICDTVKLLLTQSDHPLVVDTASNGLEAIETCAIIKPDIILMDVEMPLMNGIEAAKAIRKRDKEIKIIMLTAHDHDSHIFNSFAAGADGYILKNRFIETLQTAIDTVRLGSVWLDPAIARRILELSRASATSRIGLDRPLSRKEKETLHMVANCTGEFCLVEPKFVEKLHKLAAVV